MDSFEAFSLTNKSVVRCNRKLEGFTVGFDYQVVDADLNKRSVINDSGMRIRLFFAQCAGTLLYTADYFDVDHHVEYIEDLPKIRLIRI